jgi:hypothetical protein
VLSIVHELMPANEPRFENTLFMGAGPCSSHARVVHSYGRRPEFARRGTLKKTHIHIAKDTDTDTLGGPSPRCDGSPVRFGVGVMGEPTQVVRATSWQECCDIAHKLAVDEPDPLEWMFENSSTPSIPGNCSVFTGLWFNTEPRDETQVGRVQGGRPLEPSDFYDLCVESTPRLRCELVVLPSREFHC